MLGERQKAAAAELAQWWDGLRLGGTGSHAVLLAGPAGWGRSTVLDQLHEIISRADAPVSLVVRMSGRSLPDGSGQQAAALRDALLGAEVRRQAAELLCRSRLRGAARLGVASLLLSGMAGTISLLLAGLAAAAAGGVADDSPASENGAAARAGRVVAAVSASAPVVVLIDDADYLEPGLAVTMIENLIDHHDSRVLVVAAVDLGSDLEAALKGSPDNIGIDPDAFRLRQNVRRLGAIVLDEFSRAKRRTDQRGKHVGILLRPALPDREHLDTVFDVPADQPLAGRQDALVPRGRPRLDQDKRAGRVLGEEQGAAEGRKYGFVKAVCVEGGEGEHKRADGCSPRRPVDPTDHVVSLRSPPKHSGG